MGGGRRCGRGPMFADAHLLCGEEKSTLSRRGCDRPFHLACVQLEAVPNGDWVCASCTAEDASRRLRPTTGIDFRNSVLNFDAEWL